VVHLPQGAAVETGAVMDLGAQDFVVLGA